MTTIVRDGITYYEYTPQELDEIRLRRELDYRQARGWQGSQKFSSLLCVQTTTHKTGVTHRD